MKTLRSTAVAASLLAAGLASANRIDIVSEQQAAQSWLPDPAQQKFVAGYPSTAADPTRDVCVNVGYLINADGSTSNFTEMKTWAAGAPDGVAKPAETQPYVQVAAAVVSRWHFVPVGKPHSIYTSASFAFDGSKKLGEPAILGNCRIDDLPTFVARAKAKADSRGDLARTHAERMRADRSMVEPMGTNQY